MSKSLLHCPGPAHWRGCLAVTAFAVLFILGSASAPSARPLVVGSISLDPVGEARILQPFADYLASQLTSRGIVGGKVVIAESIDEMVSLFRAQNVDLLVHSSVSALMVNELSGSKFLLRRWRDGRNAHRSVVIVRKDSPISFLSELSDETVAFEEPFSTTGFMLPALAMASTGLRMVPLDGTAQTPPQGTVGYVMGYDSETQMAWVERHQVAAAALAETDYKALVGSALTPLRVLYASPVVPDHVVVYGAHLDGDLVSRIRETLLNAHDSRQGADMLDAFERTTMFDDIPPDMFQNMKALIPGLRRLLETGN